MTRARFDIAVLGSGFAGSLLAMIARRLNLSVVLIERDAHPRFAIGESTSPLANLLIADFATRYDLPRLAPLAEYGSWMRAYPDLTRGLKRGFSFFHHERNRAFQTLPDRRNQLLVAASPNDEVADTHWVRADVDAFLVREAQGLGVEYFDRTSLSAVVRTADRWSIDADRATGPLRLSARFVVDATGPRGALHRALRLGERRTGAMPPTATLYSHFANVSRTADVPAFQTRETPPYPVDAAALHHVFDGGWMWVLGFDNGVTSAGVVLDGERAREFTIADGARAWRRVLEAFPSIGEQFVDAEPLRPFVYAPSIAFRAAEAAGDGWALLPSAAGFVDPIFSTGIPLTLLGIERLAHIFATHWREDLTEPLSAYAETTFAELDAVARFVASGYASFDRFQLFAAYSMFYFAAASYSEMARRLGRSRLARRFLAIDRTDFAASLDALGAVLRSGVAIASSDFAGRVREAIDALNVAGLADPAKRNWYGVDPNDAIAAARKLDASPLEIKAAFG